jgi:hypothetical protein
MKKTILFLVILMILILFSCSIIKPTDKYYVVKKADGRWSWKEQKGFYKYTSIYDWDSFEEAEESMRDFVKATHTPLPYASDSPVVSETLIIEIK